MLRRLRAWEQLLFQGLFVLVGAFVLLPLWSMVQMAFDGSIRGWPLEFRLWPKEPTLAIFQQMWARPAPDLTFLDALRNTLVVCGGAAAASLVLGGSMAYAFARMRFPGRQAGLFALLVGALLPQVALMTPLYLLLTALKIRTSLIGLMVVYTAFALPFCIWNLRAAFQAISRELEEAAFLDGASAWGAFWHINLPLALPAIGSAAALAFLAGYTEFAMAWLFVDRGANVTLAMAVSGMVGSYSVNWSSLAALSLMMSLPVGVLFVLLQRYLLSGLLVGGRGEGGGS